MSEQAKKQLWDMTLLGFFSLIISFIYKIMVFVYILFSINVTKGRWKCVMVLVKKNICVKILLHANIQALKAALVRNYFYRHNNFGLHSSRLLSLSLSLSLLLSGFRPNKQTFSLERWITDT